MQTSGGLLATVPAHLGQQAVDALREAGYGNASIIGTFRTINAGAPAVRIVVDENK
jgi:hydrogenase maturation factor